MGALERIEISKRFIAVSRELRMTAMPIRRGPPERVDGFSVAIVEMTHDAPHRGELHPDGDELICILAGRVTVTIESSPDTPLELAPGDACIVPRGEWHRVHLLEPTRMLVITPGPNGNHRPL